MGTGMWDEGSWERWDLINILGLPFALFFFQLGLLKLAFHSNTVSSAVISLPTYTPLS
jgi:hypothetical protein